MALIFTGELQHLYILTRVYKLLHCRKLKYSSVHKPQVWYQICWGTKPKSWSITRAGNSSPTSKSPKRLDFTIQEYLTRQAKPENTGSWGHFPPWCQSVNRFSLRVTGIASTTTQRSSTLILGLVSKSGKKMSYQTERAKNMNLLDAGGVVKVVSTDGSSAQLVE